MAYNLSGTKLDWRRRKLTFQFNELILKKIELTRKVLKVLKNQMIWEACKKTKIQYFNFPGDIQKNSSMDYKSNSSCSSPGKQDKSTLERMERSDRSHPAFGAPVPVLPVRNNLRASHFPPAASRFHFRKGLSSRCSWKCTAIVFIILFVLLLAIASYMSGEF